MNTETFVKSLSDEKKLLLEGFLNNDSSAVFHQLQAMELSDHQSLLMQEVIENILTDTLYTILLGLAGEASLGGVQEQYQLSCNGIQIDTDSIGEYAWEYFQDG